MRRMRNNPKCFGGGVLRSSNSTNPHLTKLLAVNASIREGTNSPSFAVGLLTRYLFDFKAFSLERIEQWHFV